MPCSTVRTDGFPSYPGLEEYNHEPQVQRHQEEGEHVLPVFIWSFHNSSDGCLAHTKAQSDTTIWMTI
jgi:hypothetical protein